MTKLFIFLVAFFCLTNCVWAVDTPKLSQTDRVRLSEAFRVGEKLSNKIWDNWNQIPFGVLLVTPENEFLIRHPKPSKDFGLINTDALLKSDVFWRQRMFNPGFLATFPAVGGVSTIVVGQAENTTRKTSTPWVITLLHEHFHQLQDSQPGIYQEIDRLDLSGGDQTGMWMLNYPFPYADETVGKNFESLCLQLADLIETENKSDFQNKLSKYLAARKQFEQSLKPADYKYFSFQLWKEGVARYTEYKIAAVAANVYKPTREFERLKDYQTYRQTADEIRGRIITELKTLELKKFERVAFYPFGAGEALLLDKANPNWKKRYLSEKFFIEKYFEKRK
jgi:hypothetical protein